MKIYRSMRMVPLQVDVQGTFLVNSRPIEMGADVTVTDFQDGITSENESSFQVTFD